MKVLAIMTLALLAVAAGGVQAESRNLRAADSEPVPYEGNHLSETIQEIKVMMKGDKSSR